VRMFAITGIYHRYFSHRTYKTSRPTQFIFALLDSTTTQRGPLWWAANHRTSPQFRYAGRPPFARALRFRSHAGWFMSRRCHPTQYAASDSPASLSCLQSLRQGRAALVGSVALHHRLRP
jgi:stearoyl-CoA desaturase (delta-9 desaturase)